MPRQAEEAVTVSGRPQAALARAVHLVRPDGEVFAGAAATREFFRYVPGGALVRAVCRVPGVMSIAEVIYARVARQWGPVSD